MVHESYIRARLGTAIELPCATQVMNAQDLAGPRVRSVRRSLGTSPYTFVDQFDGCSSQRVARLPAVPRWALM
jgi:hypothetical protein